MKKILVLICIVAVLALLLMTIRHNMRIQSGYEQFEITTDMTPSAPVSEFDLPGSWEWVSSTDASGDGIRPKNSEAFILTFADEGRLSSTTDCNAISGSFIQNEEVISIGSLVSTRMGCEGETFEAVYASQLSLASSYQIDGETLTVMLAKDAGTMTFKRHNI